MSNKKENAAMTTAAEAHALVPRLRFSEFLDAGGWEKKLLGEVYIFKGNNSLSRDKLNYIGGSFKNIHYGDIHKRFAQKFYADTEPVPYINDNESHSAIRVENFCMDGDIIFADASEDIEDIGKAIEIIDSGDIPLVAGLHTILARPKEKYFAMGFGAYLFSSKWIRRQIQHESQGTKVLGLSSARLSNVTLLYPQKEEQQKIADCLGSIDELITLESQKLDALKRHKKGLMQQLFPREGETVPRLRFPEFEERWIFVNIADFFNLTDKAEKITTFDKEKVLTVKLHAVGVVKSERGTLTGSANYFNRKAGQFIFSKIDLLNGAFGVIPTTLDGFASSSDVPAYSFNAEHSSSFFINWFKAKYKFLEIERTGTSSTLKRVSPEKFLSLAILVPTFVEQQKIADCLTSLDDRITAQTQKIESLKTHKKGLMQQLFPTMDEVRE